MFKELLMKSLASLSPDEKDEVRKVLEDPKVDEETSESKEEMKKEGDEIMSKENEIDTSIDVEETKKEEPKAEEKVEETEEKVDETEEKVEETSAPAQVDESQASNGIRIEDLVTNDQLTERLAALQAKIDAVIKENEDLKNKYENKDFGNFQKQGMQTKDKVAEDSFEEYSRNFMS